MILGPRKIVEPPGFAKLSKAEKVRYLQALWDQLSEDPEDVPVLDSQLDLIDERIAEHRRDPQPMRPAHELLDELDDEFR